MSRVGRPASVRSCPRPSPCPHSMRRSSSSRTPTPRPTCTSGECWSSTRYQEGARRRSTRVRRHLERRLEALPRYRQRLSRRTTGGLRWPEWEVDDRFDIAAHVTRAALPRPGGERELLAWAADFWSHRLDRARPLWRACAPRGTRRRALGARHQDAPLPRGRRRLDRRGHGAARCRAEARRRGSRRPGCIPRRSAAARIRCAAWPACRWRRRRRPRERFAIRDAPPRRSTPRARGSSCSYATSSSPRHGRASTCSSASIAGWPSPRWRSRTSRRSSGRSAGRSTTSCSRSSPQGCASCS